MTNRQKSTSVRNKNLLSSTCSKPSEESVILRDEISAITKIVALQQTVYCIHPDESGCNSICGQTVKKSVRIVIDIWYMLALGIPDAHEHLSGNSHLYLKVSFLSDQNLSVGVFREETSLGSASAPGALNHRLSQILVAMCNSARL